MYVFLKLAIANILSNMTVPLTDLFNVAFLGHLKDIEHLTAVTLTLTIFDSLFYGFSFLRMGTTGLTAQATGQEDEEMQQLILLRNGLMAISLGLGILIFQIPLQDLAFRFLHTTPEVEAIGRHYFEIRILAIPASFLSSVAIGWLLGRGMSNTVLGITAVGNITKIGLDYVFIVHLGWASVGAGWSVVTSQYLTVVLSLILSFREFSIREIPALAHKIIDRSAWRSLFAFNSNILVRSLAKLLVLLAFAKIGTSLGTSTFTENALLLEIIFCTIFLTDGLGYAIETLTGVYKGQSNLVALTPLLQVAFLSSFLIAMVIGLTTIIFPQTTFGLLTNHLEIIVELRKYTPLLTLVLGFTAITAIQEAYFLGLTEGVVIRNSNLVGTCLGFAPAAFAALKFHDDRLLWLAMVLAGATQTITYGFFQYKSASR